jgi:CRP/FNR family transcriptional regulator, cyclic AMP receptor protein
LQSFDTIKCVTAYPKGALLFVEGQAPVGVFVLCKGSVKMSVCAGSGKVIVVRMAKPGEILGLSATLSGRPYELTAETAEPCQVSFVKRNAYLRFLREYPNACFKVTEQLSERYRLACEEVRWLGLVRTADQRLAKLLLDWNANAKLENFVELPLTQEEIAQLIGTTRETVSRLFTDLKHKGVIECAGPVFIIRNRSRLEDIAGFETLSTSHGEIHGPTCRESI